MDGTMFLDIETLGSTADNYMVTAIGLAFDEETPTVLFAETPGEEKKMLEEFVKTIQAKRPKLLITWHGSDFDCPFLRTRGILNDIDISILDKIKHIDLRHFCNTGLMLSQKRLMDVAKTLHLKKENTLDGLDMPRFYFQHALGNTGKKEILIHCADDVNVTRQLYKKIKCYLESGGKDA